MESAAQGDVFDCRLGNVLAQSVIDACALCFVFVAS